MVSFQCVGRFANARGGHAARHVELGGQQARFRVLDHGAIGLIVVAELST